jgi:uncharacterized integral membrane protein
MLATQDGERRDDYSALAPIDDELVTASSEDTPGIAWGFVAFLLGAALLAIFVIQNTEEILVEFLFWDVTMSTGVVIMVMVLVTLTFDQVISLLYRRSQRKKRTMRAERP